MAGSAEAGDGATTIGSGHEAIGVLQPIGIVMLIGPVPVTGTTDIVPNATRAFAGSMGDGKR